MDTSTFSQNKIVDNYDLKILEQVQNDEDAIALFERAKPQLESAKVTTLRLDSQALRPVLVDIAIENSLIFLD